MSDWHLAQINIGRMLGLRGDPKVQGFFDALDEINALADRSPGFVWRLIGDGPDATDLQPTADPYLLINMSVWTDADSLFDYVYRSAHTRVMAQRRQWLERFDSSYHCLWWIPAGSTPSTNDGFAKLWHLDRFGPSPQAFTFKSRFPAPYHAGPPVDMRPDPWCEGNA